MKVGKHNYYVCSCTHWEKENLIKDELYDQLTRTLQNLWNHDRKIILGDFNFKIGTGGTFYPNVGSWSLQWEENNGILQADFAVTNSRVIGSTL